jgi:hypothetical protein
MCCSCIQNAGNGIAEVAWDISPSDGEGHMRGRVLTSCLDEQSMFHSLGSDDGNTCMLA